MVQKFSEYTFGIYLTHYFALDLFRELYTRFFGLSITSIIYRLTAPCCVIIACITGINILRKSAIGRTILP